MAFQFPTPPPLEQVGGLASGMAQGQQIFQPMIQEMRARQQFPMQQQTAQQHLQQMAQTIKNNGLEAPLQRELLKAQTAETLANAKRQHAVLPGSKMGKLVDDYNNAKTAGDERGADHINTAIKNELSQENSKNLSVGETAYRKKAATDFVAGATIAGTDAANAYDAEKNMDTFSKVYPKLPWFTRGALYADPLTHPKLHRLQAAHMNPQERGDLDLAIKTSNRLVQNILAGHHYGRISNRILEMTQKSTLSPGMYESGVKRLVPLLKMQAQITQQKPLFYDALRQAGITDGVKANSLWQKYLSQTNLVDDKDVTHPENLGNWRNFIPKGGQQAQAGQQMVKVQLPDGSIGSVPVDKVDKIIKEKGAKRL